MADFWTSFKAAIKTGAWLTPQRARVYCLMLLVLAVLASAVWVALSHGLIDPNGKPIGTDFASFYAAGQLALEGRAVDAYDMAAHFAREQKIFGAGVPYYAWLYPPLFLLIAAPLALLPYPLALIVWQGVTLALYLGVIGLILRGARGMCESVNRHWLLAALAFPAVFVNLGHGQNGCLTAALFGGALVALPRRPLLAGVLFGLLAYKPQFALVIPFALLAGGHWRAILAACLTVTVLTGVSAMLFGTGTWFAFAASTEISRKLLLEQGDVGFEKLQSVFAAIRMWGGGVGMAYVVQGVVSLAAMAGTAWAWRCKIGDPQKSVILIVATLLASPHVLDYDLMLLGIALAFYVAAGLTCGFRDYEITLLAFAWAVPLVARGIAGMTGVPLGLVAMIALYLVALRRAAIDPENLNRPHAELARA